MAKRKIELQIITPSRKLFDEQIDMAVIRTSSGDMGVMYDHEPVVTTLDLGVVRIQQNGEERRATLFGGFAEILPHKVTILTDAAEWPDEIDVQRAKEAKERAEKRLAEKKQDSDHEILRAQAALRRALVRIEVGESQMKKQ